MLLVRQYYAALKQIDNLDIFELIIHLSAVETDFLHENKIKNQQIKKFK